MPLSKRKKSESHDRSGALLAKEPRNLVVFEFPRSLHRVQQTEEVVQIPFKRAQLIQLNPTQVD